ncbi:Fe(3+)-hydroxamate ABC transporter permease FhuB [Oceanospirillum sp. D5]|uniref:Fe(3+)-hydroxamate ABC transporter permease FhuB n=1 Tax=Oceanospirillum sediminis TaxID=2760088 RepID=A0A839IP05_9GAMM|nr:Fe(3+)-hydroxamate ABC transporter permease FhuB [Oceanospirillum sediminis]
MPGFTALIIALSLIYLQIGTEISPARQWQLIMGQPSDTFGDYEYFYARLPRLAMVLLVGMVMGLTGSLIQQLTRNPLLSPMTLGTSSGAWLALIILNIWWPALVEDYAASFAMLGALLSMALVILIAGWQNLSGLPVVLAGMSVNILLGALTSAIILLNDQYARNLFIWGAGDLSQNGWDSVLWLLPRLSAIVLILAIGPRVLTLLRLGQEGAAARGMNVAALFLLLMVCGIWLVSSVLTVVGVIGFIGLIAPNIARSLGAVTARSELLVSAALGILLLLMTDSLALYLSQFTVELIPSGITAALVGAPALIWFTHRRLSAQDQLFFRMPQGAERLSRITLLALVLVFLLVLFASSFVQLLKQGWLVTIPSEFIWSLRWPRISTAIAAGSGMAIAGVIMQRLIHNPLASPDLLGMSAGAVFAIVVSGMLAGQFDHNSGPVVAFGGSMLTLAILLMLGRRKAYAPSVVIMTGIALAALIETLVQFVLIKGTDDVYSILRWLSGSTYKVDTSEAILLLAGTVIMVGLALICHRWLTLISAGRSVAQARGLDVNRAFVLLLMISAGLCALTTAVMGPVAFIGLLAPHMAAMLGARAVVPQLLVAAMLGATFLLLADWLGQVVIYPAQLSAGTVVSLIGGSYFVFLLLKGRVSKRSVA